MSLSKAGWEARGRKTPHKPTDLSISNYKDSMKSPAAALSGFPGLGVAAATRLLRWTNDQQTRVAGYGHHQPASTPRHQPSA